MDLYRHTMIELFFFDFVIDLGKSIDNAMLNVMHIIKTMSYVSKLFDKFHSHLESFLGINIIDSRLVLIEGGRLYELLIGRHLIGT